MERMGAAPQSYGADRSVLFGFAQSGERAIVGQDWVETCRVVNEEYVQVVGLEPVQTLL